MNDKNIVLIGFMGCGKTTVGQLLATHLDYKLVDTDELVVKNAKMSISEIFRTYNETYFRLLEFEAVTQLAKKTKTVISCGGGVVKNYKSVRILKRNGFIIYLKSSADKIYTNTAKDAVRPLLMTDDRMETIQTMLEEREPLYLKSCDIVLEISEIEPPEIVKKIVEILEAENENSNN